MDSDVREVIFDMRDRLVRIETRMEVLPEIQEEQKRHAQEILKAKTSVKVVRWLLGAIFLSVPAAVAAAVRIFKG